MFIGIKLQIPYHKNLLGDRGQEPAVSNPARTPLSKCPGFKCSMRSVWGCAAHSGCSRGNERKESIEGRGKRMGFHRVELLGTLGLEPHALGGQHPEVLLDAGQDGACGGAHVQKA